MKILYRYIFFLVCVILLHACSLSELDMNNQPDCIKFVARSTSYVGYDLGVESTKTLSDSESTQITTFENKILSAYCIVFGNDGSRIGDVVSLTVTDNVIDPYTLYHNYSTGPLTVCFLANIPASYVQSIDHIDDFENLSLNGISYSSYQTENKDVVIVPEIGGNKCLPMFGSMTQSYENGVLAGVTQDENGNHVVTVPLLRLFSRVNVSIEVATSTSILLNKSNFNINRLAVNNLPTKVRLKKMTSGNESAWVRTSGDFHAPITLNPDIKIENGSLISSPSFDFVCYVPEYCLLPDATKVDEVNGMTGITDAQKQKYKPNLYDPAKYPVHLDIVGKSSQPNFVDVPLEYKIFLGENAFDSFSFYRNTKYNNNISINGMGDAVLGTDDRVEATYHNLADPNNTGNPNPANCYIISKPGRYLLPTYIGNQVSGGTQIGGASVDAPVHLSGNTATDKITNVRFLPANHEDNTLGQDCIMFDVNMYDSSNAFSPADVVGSNKLICLKNSAGQIIWSWHLWLCKDGNRPDTEGYLNTYPTTGAIVMNRALGATNHQGIEALGYSLAYWDDGLYYQWGRKDPLLPSGNTTASASTYAKAKQNPRTFYTDWKGTYTAENNTDAVGWTSSKSVNDPCPPGYKVPSTQIWRTSNNSSTGLEEIMENLGLDGYPYNLQSNGGLSVNIVYPFSSYLDASGSKMIYEKIPLKDSNGNTTLYSTVRSINLSVLGKYDLRLKYSGTSTIILLRLWGSSCSLYYDTEEFAIDETNIVVQYKRSTASSYSEINLSSLSSVPLIGNRLVSYAADLLGELKAPKENYKVENPIPASVLSHGAHVRCVRDQ